MSAAPLVCSSPSLAPDAPRQLYRIRFNSGGDSRGLPVLVQLQDPQPASAVLVQHEELSEDVVLPEAKDGELLVIYAGLGSQTGHVWRQRLEQWMVIQDGGSHSVLEVPSFNERVLWRPGQALIIGNAERCQELLQGVVAFAWYEGYLRRMEGEVAKAWEPAQLDIGLAHQVQARDLARQEHVNNEVRRTLGWRMAYARLESNLEKAPLHLNGSVRRLYNELAMQSEVHDRLKTLDDRIEVLQELYELATTRLSEYRYFRTELHAEWFIVVFVLLEAVFSLWAILGR